MSTPLLALYTKITRWPLGHWVFSKAVCFKAPYFSSISPTITRLENGRCEARIHDHRAVRNHIGTVHAIALCNLAELCAGLMIDDAHGFGVHGAQGCGVVDPARHGCDEVPVLVGTLGKAFGTAGA